MTIQSTGPISLSQIGNEFTDSTPHSMSEFYGEDVGVPDSGTLSFSTFYSKTETFELTVQQNQENFNVFDFFNNGGWSPGQHAKLTIPSGITIYNSNQQGTALSVGDTSAQGFPSGTRVEILNYGSIIGGYGEFGSAGVSSAQAGTNGTKGGTAILIQPSGADITMEVIINNYGDCYGGGGGGGGGGAGTENLQFGSQEWDQGSLPNGRLGYNTSDTNGPPSETLTHGQGTESVYPTTGITYRTSSIHYPNWYDVIYRYIHYNGVQIAYHTKYSASPHTIELENTTVTTGSNFGGVNGPSLTASEISNGSPGGTFTDGEGNQYELGSQQMFYKTSYTDNSYPAWQNPRQYFTFVWSLRKGVFFNATSGTNGGRGAYFSGTNRLQGIDSFFPTAGDNATASGSRGGRGGELGGGGVNGIQGGGGASGGQAGAAGHLHHANGSIVSPGSFNFYNQNGNFGGTTA